MKRIVLFIVVMFLIGTTAQATDQRYADDQNRVMNRYRNAQPIFFVEGGITFLVYSEGEIDFEKPRRRYRHHTDWGNRHQSAPGHSQNYKHRSRHTVRYDYYGRLNRVGLTTVSYNRYDQVRRIGSVLVRYNRRGLVSKIGGLHIYYNRYGTIKHMEGAVHYTGCGYCGINGCSASHTPYYDFDKNRRHYNHDNYHHYKKRKKKHNDDDDDND